MEVTHSTRGAWDGKLNMTSKKRSAATGINGKVYSTRCTRS